MAYDTHVTGPAFYDYAYAYDVGTPDRVPKLAILMDADGLELGYVSCEGTLNPRYHYGAHDE